MIDTLFTTALLSLVVLGLAGLILNHPAAGGASVATLFALMMGAHWHEQRRDRRR